MSAASPARQVLAVKYGHRVTTRAESYLNFHLYGEPDADLDIDYYFWVIRDGAASSWSTPGSPPRPETAGAARTTRPPRRRCRNSASTRTTSPPS